MDAVTDKVDVAPQVSEEVRAYWQGILDDLAKGQDVIIQQGGQSVAVVIPYEDYRAIAEALEDYRDVREAEAAYQEWQQDPSTAVDYKAFRAELAEEGRLD